MDDHLLLVVSADHLDTKRTTHGSSRGVPGNPVAEVEADWIVEGIGVQSSVILGRHFRHGKNTWPIEEQSKLKFSDMGDFKDNFSVLPLSNLTETMKGFCFSATFSTQYIYLIYDSD